MPGAFGPGDALVDCVRVHMSVRKSALRLGASLPLARVVLSVPIASASAQGSPTQDRQPPAVVRGAVYDSLRQEPFRFAQVVLAGIGASQGRNLGMRADTNGRFELIGVPRGAYRVGFYHPALDSLGIEVAPVDVRVESDTTVIQLGSPSALAVRGTICHGAAEPSEGMVWGEVRDAVSEAVIEGAVITGTWIDAPNQSQKLMPAVRAITAASSDRGGFALCGIPANVELTIRVVVRADSLGPLRVTLANGAVRHLPLYVPRVDSATKAGASAASGSVSGTVSDALGRPLRNANISMLSGGRTTQSDENGDFRLDGLPLGSRAIVLTAIGYAPWESVINVRSFVPNIVSATLQAVQNLAPVISPRQPPMSVLKSFVAHRRRSAAGSSLVRTTRHLPLTSRFCSACESFRE